MCAPFLSPLTGLAIIYPCLIPTTNVVGYILSPLTGLFTVYRFAARFLLWLAFDFSALCSI
jgi:hypothetical protein